VDIYFPKSDELSISEPFVLHQHEAAEVEEGQDIEQSLNPSTTCPEYSETGKCREGLKCRFLGAHAKAVSIDGSKTIQVLEDLEKSAAVKDKITELNPVRPGLLKSLRTRQVS
jgi:tRNA-dihydrouridine synthase 3